MASLCHWPLTERPLQDRPSNESSLDSPPSNGDHEVTQNMFKNLKHIGPGAIVASATIGAGETVLAVRVGAWGGYDLLCRSSWPPSPRVSHPLSSGSLCGHERGGRGGSIGEFPWAQGVGALDGAGSGSPGRTLESQYRRGHCLCGGALAGSPTPPPRGEPHFGSGGGRLGPPW